VQVAHRKAGPAASLRSRRLQDAEFFRIKTPKVADVPVFALSKVSDFSVHFCNGVPDTHIDHTDQQTVG